jgi:hypothetical protein
VIRQAISCDICASEKKQTNHWFVAYELAGELRVSGWNSRNRLRPGSKHLCGQTCLHKLVDDFMARAIAVRPQAAASCVPEALGQALIPDTSLTSGVACPEVESSARLLTPPEPAPRPSPIKTLPELVTIPTRSYAAHVAQPPDEQPRYASRNWRAEAWEREREREMRALERHPEIARRRPRA